MSIIARLRTDRGASVVEYALIVVLVAGIVLAVTVLGKRVAGNFSTMSDCYDGTCATSTSSGGSSSNSSSGSSGGSNSSSGSSGGSSSSSNGGSSGWGNSGGRDGGRD